MNRRTFLFSLLGVAASATLLRAQDETPVAKAIIIKKKCVGCGDCVRACPVKAILMIHGKAHVDPGKCIGCRLCKLTCAYGAPHI